MGEELSGQPDGGGGEERGERPWLHRECGEQATGAVEERMYRRMHARGICAGSGRRAKQAQQRCPRVNVCSRWRQCSCGRASLFPCLLPANESLVTKLKTIKKCYNEDYCCLPR